MSATAPTAVERTVTRGTVVSVAGHVVIGLLGVLVAADKGDDPVARAFWLLGLYAGFGLVAGLLARASVKGGMVVWNLGVVALGLAVLTILWAATVDGAAAMLIIGATMLFADVLLFSNARKAISGP